MRKCLVLLSLLFLSACQKTMALDLDQFKDFQMTPLELRYTLEYGIPFDKTELHFELLKNGLNVEDIDIKTDVVEEVDYTILVDHRPYTIRVDVVDTQFPNFEGEKDFTITQGEALDLSGVKAFDPVDGELEVVFSEFDKDKVGTQTIYAKATDQHNNTSNLEIRLVVKEKKVLTDTPSSTTPSSKPSSNSNANSSSPSTSTPQTPSGVVSGDQALINEVVRLVNVERNNRGLASLSTHSLLMKSAQAYSEDMSERGTMSHYGSPTYGDFPGVINYYNVPWRSVAENIGYGYRSAQSIVNAWMNSPGHRDNILNPNFTHIGVGVSSNFYWTQHFAML